MSERRFAGLSAVFFSLTFSILKSCANKLISYPWDFKCWIAWKSKMKMNVGKVDYSKLKSPADRAPGLDEVIGHEQEKAGVGDK